MSGEGLIRMLEDALVVHGKALKAEDFFTYRSLMDELREIIDRALAVMKEENAKSR